MEQRGFKEVYFDSFCSQCMHKELEEKFDPCNECLEYGAREGTHKPLHFKPNKDHILDVRPNDDGSYSVTSKKKGKAK